jgi:hypothetical protein
VTDSETKAHQGTAAERSETISRNEFKIFCTCGARRLVAVLTTKPRQSAARLPCSNTRREGSGYLCPCRKSALFSARIKPKALYRRIYGEPPDGMTRPTWLLSKGLKGPDRRRPHPHRRSGHFGGSARCSRRSATRSVRLGSNAEQTTALVSQPSSGPRQQHCAPALARPKRRGPPRSLTRRLDPWSLGLL